MLEEASGSRVTLVKILSGGDVDLITPLHEMAGEGVFAKELQAALLAGEVDVVVHSLKDLPLQMPESAPVVAIPPRESPADLLVLMEEGDGRIPPNGARIGTSSPRRQSQLLALDRDIVPVDLRGNVDTRLRKLREGWVDGLILAEAARDRLPGDLFEALVTHRLPLDIYPTAPGQGAIALQTLARGEAASIARRVDDDETRRAVEAERTLLAELGGGCGMPLGMTVRRDGDMWIADASLASAAWREEGPPRLSRAHLVTGSLADVVPHVLGALRQPPAAASEVPAGAGHRRVLLVADAETSAAYRPRLEAVDFRVESWYPFEYESTVEGPLPRDLLDAWKDCGWVLLTSHRAAEALARLAREAPRVGPRIGVVGPRTAAALRRRGLPVHFVARGETADALVRELAALAAADDRFLYLAAEDARDDISRGLKESGLAVTQHSVYRPKHVRDPGAPGSGAFDAAVVFSPKGAIALAEHPGKKPEIKAWVAIGPTTADALRGRVTAPVLVAERRTPAGVLDALREAGP